MNQPEKSGYYWFNGIRKISIHEIKMEEPVGVVVGGPGIGSVSRTGDMNYYLLENFVGEWTLLDPELLR